MAIGPAEVVRAVEATGPPAPPRTSCLLWAMPLWNSFLIVVGLGAGRAVGLQRRCQHAVPSLPPCPHPHPPSSTVPGTQPSCHLFFSGTVELSRSGMDREGQAQDCGFPTPLQSPPLQALGPLCQGHLEHLSAHHTPMSPEEAVRHSLEVTGCCLRPATAPTRQYFPFIPLETPLDLCPEALGRQKLGGVRSVDRWGSQLGREVGRLGGREGLCAGSSPASTQAASKIYLYSPLEFLPCFIIVLSKWNLTGLGSHHCPAFFRHLSDYK